MGVHGLWDLLSPVGRRLPVEVINGKRLAVDASVWLIQFVRAMRDAEGMMVRHAHLIGFFRRCCKLLFHNIRPLFVFDGETPALKKGTLERRRSQHEKQTAKLKRVAERMVLNRLKETAMEGLINGRSRISKKRRIDVPKQSENDVHGTSNSVTGLGGTGELDESAEIKERPALIDAVATAFSDEEGSEGEYNVGFLPEEGMELDMEVLRNLPARLQIEAWRNRTMQLRASHRERIVSVAESSPTDFSRAQISNFLRSTKMLRDMRKSRRIIAGAAGDERRVASDANRSFVFKKAQDKSTSEKRAGALVERPELAAETKEKVKKTAKEVEASIGWATRVLNVDGPRIDPVLPIFSLTREDEGKIPVPDNRKSNVVEKQGQEEDSDWEVVEMAPGPEEGKIPDNIPQLLTEDPGKSCGEGLRYDVEETVGLEAQRSYLGSERPLTIPPKRGQWTSAAISGFNRGWTQTGATAPVERGAEEEEVVEVDAGSLVNVGDHSRQTQVGKPSARSKRSEVSALRAFSRGWTMTDEVESDSTSGRKELAYSKESQELENFTSFESHNLTKGRVRFEEPEQRLTSARKSLEESRAHSEGVDSGNMQQASDPDSPRARDKKASGLRDKGSVDKAGGEDVDRTHTRSLSVQESKDSTASGELQARQGDDAQKGGVSLVDEIVPVLEMDLQDLNEETKSPLADQQPLVLEEEKDADYQQAILLSLGDSKSAKPTNTRHKPEEQLANQEITSETMANKDYMLGTRSESLAASTSERNDGTPAELAHNAKKNERVGEAPQAELGSAPSSEKNLPDESENTPSSHLTPEEQPNGSEWLEDGLATEQLDAKESEEAMKGVLAEMAESLDPEELEAMREKLAEEREFLQEEVRARRSATGLVSEEMYAETRDLLRIFGIPYLEAPYEAEAQCSWLNEAGLVEGVITEDSDAFLFGARNVYKNIFEKNKFVEGYDMKDAEREMGLDREKLIHLALLLGSDYTEGVRGVGIVNASEILEAFPGANGLIEFRDWIRSITLLDKEPTEEELGALDRQSAARRIFCWKHRNIKRNWELRDSFPSEQVKNAYAEPSCNRSTAEFSWRSPDFDMLRRFCWEKFGWRREDADALLVPLEEELKRRQEASSRHVQTKINSFFQPERFALIRSERLGKAIKGMAGTDNSSHLLVGNRGMERPFPSKRSKRQKAKKSAK